jgi:DNA-binding transcriptional LysR family regulator
MAGLHACGAAPLSPMLTLRQIEVIRAIMVTGTVGGAARLLNTSSPGISRVMKHAEDSLGLKLFSRKNGRYAPTPEARDIFSQINNVYDKVEDLRFVVDRLRKGSDFELRIGAVPSISAVMAPRAIADVRKQFPALTVELDVLKLEEAINYLLLGRGEAAAVSAKNDHPMLTFEPLATGQLVCIVPEHHPLSTCRSVSVKEIVRYPLIGVDPNDPFGTIMTRLFVRNRLDYSVAIRARFGSTVCALVAAGLGIAIVDRFTLAGGNWPQLHAIEIGEPTGFETYVAFRRDSSISSYCEAFVAALRMHMQQQSPSRKK